MKSVTRLLFLVCLLTVAPTAFAAPIVAGSFSTTWKTDNPGNSADNEVGFFLDNGPGSVCSGVIYWEEVGNPANFGTSTLDINCNEERITFPVTGTYRVDISGTFPAFRIMDRSAELDADKLLSVEQWGDNVWETTSRMFWGASNFVLNATDVPNLSVVTDMSTMFFEASSFNSNINNWDVSNVTNMQGLFADATSFNQPLDNWDVSNVTIMGADGSNEGMFAGAIAFNQDISGWDTSAVMTMDYMFVSTDAFNQPIGSWDVSSVTTMQAMFYGNPVFNQPLNNWNVASVTDMSLMFFFSRAFNQPLDNWSVSNVTLFTSMFRGASDFNQSLASWDIGSATDIEGIFDDTALDTFNYSSILTGWASLVGVPSGLLLDDVPTTYCDTAAAARTKLVTDSGWTIADLGLITCLTETERGNNSQSTKVGIRSERLDMLATAVSSSSYATDEVTKDTFIASVKRLLNYLTMHEDDLANLSQAESTELIVLLRDVLRQVLRWLPGV